MIGDAIEPPVVLAGKLRNGDIGVKLIVAGVVYGLSIDEARKLGDDLRDAVVVAEGLHAAQVRP